MRQQIIFVVAAVLLWTHSASAQIIPPQYIAPAESDDAYTPLFRDYDPLRDAATGLIRQIRSPQIWNEIIVVEESDTTKALAPDTLAKAVVVVAGLPILTIEISGYKNYTLSWINEELVHVRNFPGRCVSVDTLYNLRSRTISYHAVFNHCGV